MPKLPHKPEDTSPGAPVPRPSTFNTQPPSVPDHELLRRIGAGSYGEVWLARNIVGTFRAVKVVRRATFERAEHFEREFKGMQKFEPISRSHEGFVDILQIGRNDEAGYFYYVMELADGLDVESEKVGKRESEKDASNRTSPTVPIAPQNYSPKTLRGLQFPPAHSPTFSPADPTRLPVSDCVSIGVTLASALEHLHQHGLVHRDVKPSNIIFVGGVPKLADIGLVADASEARSFVGTVGFIPPEGPGSPQADLYSLGKVLYEISTGKDRQEFPQFPGDIAGRTGATPFVELNAVILKACQPDLRTRHQSAAEMHKELEWLQRGGSVKRRRTVERRWTLVRKSSAAAATLALLGTGGWLLFNRLNHSTVQRINGVPEVNSIAVLPCVNENTNWAPHEYLSDSLTEETMNALTNCAGLRVAPHPAVFAFKRTTNDLRQVGEQLGVRTVLAGSMKKSSNQLQIAARLIRVGDGSNVWSVRFDREAQDIGAMQSGVARQVARQLALSLDEQALRRMEANLMRKLAAYQLYSQTGSARDDTTDGINQTIELLNRAIAEDPAFGQAYARLAYFYTETSGWMLPPKQALTEAKKNALRAIQLDDSLAEAHTALGNVFASHELDFAKAEGEFQHAIAVDPRYEGSYAFYAILLSRLGQFEDAERTLNQGRRAFPNTNMILAGWCWRYYFERRFDEMLAPATARLAMSPDHAIGLMFLAWAQEGLRRYDDALGTAQKLALLVPSPDYIALLGRIHARMGHRDEAWKALEDLRVIAQTPRGSPLFSSQILLALGDHGRAIEQLQQAVAEYPPTAFGLKTDPFWDDLRPDPRFQALIKNQSPSHAR